MECMDSLLTDLDRELHILEVQHDRELQNEVSNMIQGMKVDTESNGFAPLPTQSAESVDFHNAIVEHYQKIATNREMNRANKKGKNVSGTKEEFMRRKQKRKQNRQQKKAADYADKKENKILRDKINQKKKRKAKN